MYTLSYNIIYLYKQLKCLNILFIDDMCIVYKMSSMSNICQVSTIVVSLLTYKKYYKKGMKNEI